MSDLFEEHARLTAKYVHACSRGHEVIQIAAGRLLEPQDYVSCYYRDDSLLLSMGVTPKELMLQLFAKKDDPFSGGRTYYSHPSLNRPGQPKIRTKVPPPACKPSLRPGAPWACNTCPKWGWNPMRCSTVKRQASKV